MEDAESLLYTLARMVEARDADTGDHCNRLDSLCAAFSDVLQFDRVKKQSFSRASVLLDVVKIAVLDAILLKPGKLTEREFKIISQHPVTGVDLFSRIKSLNPVLPIIRHHHEKFDGSGYPDGLVGCDVPLLAQVLQLVDIFDALYSERPYKKTIPLNECVDVIYSEVKRGWRKRELVDIFINEVIPQCEISPVSA